MATVQLREAIIKGDFMLGEALTEAKLAEILNISKTPVRHALAQMRVEGLVEVYPQSGTFVFTVSMADLMQLCEYRRIIEANALGLASERNLETLIQELEASTSNMDMALNLGNLRRYLDLDTNFHRIIVEFSDNDYLLESYSLIEAKTAAIRTHLAAQPLQSKHSYNEHVKLVASLKNDDLATATEILSYHIERYSRCYDDDTDDIAARDRRQRLDELSAAG
jgi:DNA-binding GntR family transcriptional regulator